tara:strand:- start:790 stop:1725 length:936 start_codon:yes stop_codon:yes gene_type:complete
MNNEISNNHLEVNEVSFKKIISLCIDHKYIFSFVVAAITIASLIFSLLLPNIYRAQVILSPVSMDTNLASSLGGGLGGLASFAGIDIQSGNAKKTDEAVAILSSLEFFKIISNKNNLAVPLLASSGWNREKNSLKIKSNIYNESSKTWVRKPKSPRGVIPTDIELFEEFQEIFLVSKDSKTGFVILSLDFYSPHLAKKWLDSIVLEINNLIRERDITTAEKSISALNDRITKTNLSEVKNALSTLIQEQTKTIVFAESTEEYAFITISPAYVPEIKHSPSRALIVSLGLLLGITLGIFLILLINLRTKHYE